jgi:hypothetical protein
MKKLYLMLQLCHQTILTSDTFVSTIETPRIYLFGNHSPVSFCNTIVSVLVMILTYVYNEELHVWYHVRFLVLTSGSMNFRVFSDIMSCSQIDVDIYLSTGSISQKTMNFSLYIVCCFGIRSYCDSTNIFFLLLQAAFFFAAHYQILNIYNSSTIHWMLIVFFCKHSHFFLNNNSFNSLKQRLL